jgi:hypothetical protein
MLRYRSSAIFLLIAASAIVHLGLNTPTSRAEITAEQVREAIDKGIKYLTQQQNPNGSWTDMMGQPGGVSALCTLALLNAGVDPADPSMQKALAYLRKIKPEMTYVNSLQTMVFCRAEPEKDRLLIARNVKWFEGTQIDEGPKKGAWSYPHGPGDNSNAQFALLALHEAERVGVRAKDQTWRLARNYWQDCQNADGSWGYYKPLAGTGSMSCAGITSLVIAEDRIQPPDAKVVRGEIKCCATGENAEENDRIDRALDWLGRNFSVTDNPGYMQNFVLYYLYGLERAGRLTARRFIGEHDWYREGADFLVRRQDKLSGFWVGNGHAENDPLIGTSFALLFLSKGRWPVLLSKVKHVPENDWNQHRHDVNNLTRFVESRWKKDMTWQVTDLSMASVDDLLQSPVLYSARLWAHLLGPCSRPCFASRFLRADPDCYARDPGRTQSSIARNETDQIRYRTMWPEPGRTPSASR